MHDTHTTAVREDAHSSAYTFQYVEIANVFYLHNYFFIQNVPIGGR